VAYSAEQVLLNKPQIYGGPAKLHWYLRRRPLTYSDISQGCNFVLGVHTFNSA